MTELLKKSHIDSEYKNNVFCDLFSQKEHAISLFNALNKSQYTNTNDLEIITLSDAFIAPKNGYEWTANMLNINIGHNKKLLKACPVLEGYSMLVYYIRKYQKEKDSLEEAVKKAIDRCIKENYLKKYLLKKKAEVRLMLLTEFNQEAYERIIKAEAENRVNQLNLRLISENRYDDLKRAVNDRDYQTQLYQEYGL